MKAYCKTLFGLVVTLFCVADVAFGFELTATVPVNQTSETAAKAKINATNLARRQILYNVLSPYAQKEELRLHNAE